MSIDPLQKKYSHLSPYNFVANNPIIFIDVDGKEFKWVTDGVKKMYDLIYKKADKETRAKLDYLDNSKLVITVTITKDEVVGLSGNNGITRYNFGTRQLDITLNANTPTLRAVGALGDELESAYIFLQGKYGETLQKNKQGKAANFTVGYDRIDETESQRAAINAQESLGISLDPSQQRFKDLDAQGQASTWFDTDEAGKSYNLPNTPPTTSADYFGEGSELAILNGVVDESNGFFYIAFVKDNTLLTFSKQGTINRIDVSQKPKPEVKPAPVKSKPAKVQKKLSSDSTKQNGTKKASNKNG